MEIPAPNQQIPTCRALSGTIAAGHRMPAHAERTSQRSSRTSQSFRSQGLASGPRESALRSDFADRLSGSDKRRRISEAVSYWPSEDKSERLRRCTFDRDERAKREICLALS